ncbi:hypothetical protein N310_02635, partial [Acanthisitta chloris]
TLPTGVSTFLIECLDTDSAADSDTTLENLKSYPSPETFRDDDSERSNFHSVDPVKYRNSTLLDCSKAVTIDKIPQISNLSAIADPALEDFQDQGTKRKRPSTCNSSYSALSGSAVVAGKKVCKITAARERTPDLNSSMHCASPLGPESKIAQPKRQKRNKKKHYSKPLEEGPSSVRQPDAPGSTSLKSGGLTAEFLPTELTDPVPPLLERQDICPIVRLSPDWRRRRPQRVTVDRTKFSFPEGVPEDNITSTKNWIYCKWR